jgi:hypothetical protein
MNSPATVLERQARNSCSSIYMMCHTTLNGVIGHHILPEQGVVRAASILPEQELAAARPSTSAALPRGRIVHLLHGWQWSEKDLTRRHLPSSPTRPSPLPARPHSRATHCSSLLGERALYSVWSMYKKGTEASCGQASLKLLTLELLISSKTSALLPIHRPESSRSGFG